MNHADKNRTGELARNVAVALRFGLLLQLGATNLLLDSPVPAK